jgi:hypothetical protein
MKQPDLFYVTSKQGVVALAPHITQLKYVDKSGAEDGASLSPVHKTGHHCLLYRRRGITVSNAQDGASLSPVHKNVFQPSNRIGKVLRKFVYSHLVNFFF